MKDEEKETQEIIEPEPEEEKVEGEELTPEEKPVSEEPKKSPLQKRIDQLTKEKYDARREAEYWKGKVTEVKPAPPKEEIPSGRPQRPNLKSFEDEAGTINYSAYDQAITKYEDDLEGWRESQRKVKGESERIKDEREKNLGSFSKQAEEARKKYADFDEIINTPVFTPAMQDTIYGSEHGADIGYYLGKNPEVAMRLGSLSPLQLAREIGKLEAKFSAKPVKKIVSEAPEPIIPVEGKDVIKKDPEKMSTDEWVAERRSSLRKLKK